MTSSTKRWLGLVVAVGTFVGATSAVAQTRASSKGAGCRDCTRSRPSYQRVALAPTRASVARRVSAGDHAAYAREIADAASRYAVPERLIWAVIRVESDFDHRAVSRKGARGLMQLMPETASLLGVRDSFNPRENIDGGTRHLRSMMVKFRYDVRLAVAAYNAGERPVMVHRGVPPYPETREYVTQVLRFYNEPTPGRPALGGDVYRIVQPNGTIVYTNVRYGQFSTALSKQ
jgi:soluble lytic murein transglycosylase-like protein